MKSALDAMPLFLLDDLLSMFFRATQNECNSFLMYPTYCHLLALLMDGELFSIFFISETSRDIKKMF